MSTRPTRLRPLAILLSALFPAVVFSQDILAVHGSPYAGSMAHEYNPAGLLNSPRRWDLTLFGIQQKSITNLLYIDGLNILPASTDTGIITKNNGYFSRYAHVTGAVDLLQFRYRFDHNNAFSVGVRLRAYAHAITTPVNYYDTIKTFQQFIEANPTTASFGAFGQASSWVEYNAGWARVLKENELGCLQAGVQVRVMQSIAGGFARISHLTFSPTVSGNTISVAADQQSMFGYSSNLDTLDNTKSGSANLRNFFSTTRLSLGLNLGLEYVRYSNENFYEADRPAGYDWKMSAALLDLGQTAYDYGVNSLATRGVQSNLTPSDIESKLGKFGSTGRFADSLRSLAVSSDSLSGRFYVNSPARLVLNFDKSFRNNFYLNAELQLAFRSTASPANLNTSTLNLFSITPRWETDQLGVFLPFQVTTEGNCWLGLAVKAGPLIAGLQNLGWLFTKTNLPNGGFYIALRIDGPRPREKDVYPCR